VRCCACSSGACVAYVLLWSGGSACVGMRGRQKRNGAAKSKGVVVREGQRVEIVCAQMFCRALKVRSVAQPVRWWCRRCVYVKAYA